MMRELAVAALLLFACGALPAAAQGPGLPSSHCGLTMSSLSFGTYTGALINGTATGVMDCSGTWNIPLNEGTGAGATVTTRKMTGPGGAVLNYQIFKDAARSSNWGNSYPTYLTGHNYTPVTAYGQLAAHQNVAPGTYTDSLSTSTTSFTVTATVQVTCAVSATALAFGNYSGAQSGATSTITVTCTNSTPYYVNLNNGLSPDSGYYPRMSGPGGSLLSYRLYQNAGWTKAWRNTFNLDGQSGTGNGLAQSLIVYGLCPAGQVAKPGAYSDTITVTVTY